MQWHSVTIELSGEDGELVTVKHSLADATETLSIKAETDIVIPSGDTNPRYMGLGVGETAEFRFDDIGTDKVVAASVGLRFHYDA